MPFRIGLGPVFKYEWLASTRRWQLYAMRSLFVSAILAAIGWMWLVSTPQPHVSTTRQLAAIGISMYVAMVFVQISMVLLVAPASTAGAVCLDKARGTMDHILTTDLSNAEVVLGKLAVRLVPMVGIVMSLLPAMVLTSLLGGVDPDALFCAFLVTLGTAIFACSLALTLSVWGTKTHEVLFASYFVLIGWVLAGPFGFIIGQIFRWGWWTFRFWNVVKFANPYYLCLAPYNDPGVVGYGTCLAYLGGCLTLSALIMSLATIRLRAICQKQAGKVARPEIGDTDRPPPRWKIWMRGPRIEFTGPSLDRNPVLWREWHRSRPTRWMKVIWGLYALFCASLSLLLFIEAGRVPNHLAELAMLVTVLQVNIGLFLVNVQAASCLSEERIRGSLDVLMTTPLTTFEVLFGKWWGAWRVLPKLMVLPALVSWFAVSGPEGPLRWLLFLVLISAYGAVAISVGLACATAISRLGRAIGTSIGLCIGSNVLAFVMMIMVDSPVNRPVERIFVALGGSFLGTGVATRALDPRSFSYEHQDPHLTRFLVEWCVIYYLIAACLFLATWGSFNHYLGRSSPFRTSFRPTALVSMARRRRGHRQQPSP